MDGIRTRHARCVLGACALAAALVTAGPAPAATHKYGGILGRIAPQRLVGYGFRTRDDGPLAAASSAQGSGQLTYHGGPVMRTNRVYAIYWVPSGYSVSAAYRNTIDGFFANVAADSGRRSNVYSLDSEYGDGTGPIAYSSTFAGSTLDTQPFPANGCTSVLPTCLTNAQLVAEIARVAAQSGWPRGVNSLFFVFTPRNVTSCWNPAGSFCFLRQYCAYHSWYQDSGGLIVFANMPYAATNGTCGGSWLNAPNHDDADATINVTSHEHNEAITDPVGSGWYDAAGYENGDKCAWDFGTQLGGSSGAAFNQRIGTGTYELQQEYSNGASGCLLEAAAGAPSVTGFSPASGAPGTQVTISGAGLAGTTAISFAGTSATFAVQSDSTVVATVPAGAVGGTIAVTTPAGTATSATAFVVTAASPPANTAGPSISGAPRVGQVLTASPGTWTGVATITYSYIWARCASGTCVAIAGATGSTYVPVLADVGASLRVLVTAANSLGVGQALSPPTAAVTGGTAPSPTTPPTIADVARVGQTLSASAGGWAGSPPTAYSYAWQRCRNGSCSTISGATRSTYAAAPADVGYALRVAVTASNAYGKATVSSAQTAAIVAVAPWSTSPPTITGTPKVGQKLTAAPGTWNGGGTMSYAYVWLRCTTVCVAISGAAGSSYVVGSADVGWKIRVFAWATNEVGRNGA